MPLKIQSGEIALRVRRFLRMVGRMPLQIDENTSPIVVTSNVDVDPYRAEPVTVQAYAAQTAVAAVNAQVALIAAGNEICVVDQINIIGAAAATVLVNLLLGKGLGNPGGIFAGANTTAVLNRPYAAPNLLRTQSFVQMAASAAVNGTQIDQWSYNTNSTLDTIKLDPPICLWGPGADPKAGSGDILILYNATVNQQLAATFRYRVYTNVQQ